MSAALAEAMRAPALALDQVRAAQARWASVPVPERLRVLRGLRHAIAEDAQALAATVPLAAAGQTSRTLADTLASEVLPLADACRFLEREAKRLLAPVRQPTRLRPLWLSGVRVETRRDALGVVLILGPGNYPLFLPGVQALQALVAGNAVLWKPAPGGAAAARAMCALLLDNGLDADLLTVLDEGVEDAQAAIGAGVDKVVLTGAAATGRAVLRRLADDLTPAVMELSGCDAVFVLEGADLGRVVEALTFGVRFNGSATCMAPRRLIVSRGLAEQIAPLLVEGLKRLAPVRVPPAVRMQLEELVAEATAQGGRVLLNGLETGSEDARTLGATLVDGGDASMRIARADIFAPVLTILYAEDADEALAVHRACPYALTASVFGPERSAAGFAERVHAGTVLVNDIILSSADPRVSFSGRGSSGFGATRGAAGLLEMTAIKNIVVQRSLSRRAWQPTTPAHSAILAALIGVLHGSDLRQKFTALKAMMKAARGLKD